MEAAGLKLTSEDGVGDFLGVKIDRKSDSEIHLTQSHLIDSFLEDLSLIQRAGQKEVATTPNLINGKSILMLVVEEHTLTRGGGAQQKYGLSVYKIGSSRLPSVQPTE
jgi:hypothetical protein